MEVYKIYFEDNNEIFYIKALAFGGEPFIKIIPAWSENDIGLFEKEKAEKYVALLKEQNKETTLKFGFEKAGILRNDYRLEKEGE